MPLSVLYLAVFGQSLTAMPLAMLLTAVGGYVVADRVLGFRRQRSTDRGGHRDRAAQRSVGRLSDSLRSG